MNTLSPTEIVAWFRAQARKYSETADQLERDFGVVGKPSRSGAQNVPEYKGLSVSAQVPSVEAVRQALGSGKMRVKQIAERLGLPEEYVRPVVTDDNGFVKGKQGWFSIKKGHGA